MTDLQDSTHGFNLNSFQNVTASVITRTLTKVFPHVKSDTQFIDYQKGPKGQHNQNHNDEENTVRNIQMMNVEDGILSNTADNLDDIVSDVEEDPVNNLRQNQHLTNHISLSLEGHHQGAFQAWQQNDILNLDQTENQYVSSLDDANNTSSRDRVKEDLTSNLQSFVNQILYKIVIIKHVYFRSLDLT